ncbi:hypothetical protein TRFO_23097 [Tritrichomonas foetus]|uniref:Uncharacterized protein n=1 Tax=Tritrichomonas foetus TaxID=1144522 RepID=A0A1J4KFL5_9EUKA|nr:hypothetical protein TRFO_23097 [Tritrichomonas foetus]|eukprot:OHT08414.1 hypothetical protein TRFO_23097 [Tritrichomonas foetus]
MYFDDTSEYEEEEMINENWVILTPLSDGHGKQYDLLFSHFSPIINFFPLHLPKLPISRHSQSYEEYQFYILRWFKYMNTAFNRCILPNMISLFYRRPLSNPKVMNDTNTFLVHDQINQIEEIMIQEIKFDKSTFFKDKLKCKSNLISTHVLTVNQWPCWLIPAAPDISFFDNYADFCEASNNWYERSIEIINDRIGIFYEDSQKSGINNLYAKPWTLSARASRANERKEKSQMPRNISPISLDNQLSSETEATLESIVLEENEFDFLCHPISFHLRYGLEMIETEPTYHNQEKANYFLERSDFLTYISKNREKYEIQTDLFTNINEKSNYQKSITCKINNLYNSYKNGFSLHFPIAENSIIFDLTNHGGVVPIKFFYASFYKIDTKQKITLDNLPFWLDTDVGKMPYEIRNGIFDFIVENYENQWLMELINNTKLLYKLAQVLLLFTPHSIDLIDPSFDSLIHEDFFQIHNLLFQWHISDIIFQVFHSLELHEIAVVFVRREALYKEAYDDYCESNSFPFEFPEVKPRKNGVKSHSYSETISLNKFSNQKPNYIHSPPNKNLGRILVSMYHVSLVYKVSSYICSNCFLFFKFISKCSYKLFLRFCSQIISKKDLCRYFIVELVQTTKIDITDSIPMVNFLSTLLQCDPLKINVILIEDYEWAIQTLKRLTKYLSSSYPHVFLTEKTLKFVSRTLKGKEKGMMEHINEWDKNISRIQGLLFAFIPYENNPIFLTSELRSFAFLMKFNSSVSFLDDREKSMQLFKHLYSNDVRILSASWKIIRNLFKSHPGKIPIYLQIEGIQQNLTDALKNQGILIGGEMLKLLVKIIEITVTPEKEKSGFLFTNGNIPDCLNSLFKIMMETCFRPFTICSIIQQSQNITDVSLYISVTKRFYRTMLVRPTLKKVIENMHFDQQDSPNRKRKKTGRKRNND